MWLDELIAIKKASKITTEDLSMASGVPVGTLNKLFTGQTKNPKIDTVYAVIHALGYKLDDFFDEDEKSASSGKDEALLESFHQLNGEGQSRLLETADDMVRSGKYAIATQKKLG